ncbi:MAG TPA: hypothetical protein VNX21_01090 [Candidatus Thermoplasmatota archaeon]|nr:hypothetical protein [Candidatus Thermoplasmatota archaeon]
MTPQEQRVRFLLARRQALENGRPARSDLLAADAAAEGLDAADLHAHLQSLAAKGLAMRVRGGWTTRPPPFPQDVTEDRAARLRFAPSHR